jgi:polyisoprenoid-binding protein YceI
MATTTAAMRTIEGRDAPPPGRYEIDPMHSDVSFVVRHLMISKVRGHFRKLSGTVRIGERPEDSSAQAAIDAASIDTGDPQRDEHLRSADFLDVEHYPQIVFASTAVRPGRNDDHWDVEGNLTIRDLTRPLTLDVEFGGSALDPWGNVRAGFQATTEIDREKFGVTWNQALESGGLLLAKCVKVEIDVEVVHTPDADES